MSAADVRTVSDRLRTPRRGTAMAVDRVSWIATSSINSLTLHEFKSGAARRRARLGREHCPKGCRSVIPRAFWLIPSTTYAGTVDAINNRRRPMMATTSRPLTVLGGDDDVDSRALY